MKKLTSFLLFFLIIVAISFIITLSTTISLITFINSLFFSSLAFIIIAGFLFILQDGMFNRAFFNFRRVLMRISNQEKWLSQYDSNRDQIPNYYIPYLLPFLAACLLLFVISIVVAFLI
jgi:hypothetical protein